jgi:8-oxo-dGTP pyrophosphatase MutT (NUDIX family)
VSESKPRDAASLILLCHWQRTWRVLMGRRSTRTRFMPEVWVFPGGRVDPADHRAVVASPLERRVSNRLDARGQAVAVAAMRETWEETGLALGDEDAPAFAPDLGRLDYVGRAITPTGNPIRYHARFFTTRIDGPPPVTRGNGELEELTWWSIDEALALPTIDVTDLMLEEALARVAKPGGARREPLFIRYRAGRPVIRAE